MAASGSSIPGSSKGKTMDVAALLRDLQISVEDFDDLIIEEEVTVSMRNRNYRRWRESWRTKPSAGQRLRIPCAMHGVRRRRWIYAMSATTPLSCN
jgi:hypothetical protein